jgi:hypothetical protein
MPAHLKPMTNLRFGRLLIGRYSHAASNGSRWWARCSCGVDCIINGSDVRAGRTTSCGCLERANRKHWLAKIADSRRGTFRIGSRSETRAAAKAQWLIDWTQVLPSIG